MGVFHILTLQKRRMLTTQNYRLYHAKLQIVLHKTTNRTTQHYKSYYTKLQIKLQIVLHKLCKSCHRIWLLACIIYGRAMYNSLCDLFYNRVNWYSVMSRVADWKGFAKVVSTILCHECDMHGTRVCSLSCG